MVRLACMNSQKIYYDNSLKANVTVTAVASEASKAAVISCRL